MLGKCLEQRALKLVVIIHRHGARFPNKIVPRDLSWPNCPQFFEDYAGTLTPEAWPWTLPVNARSIEASA